MLGADYLPGAPDPGDAAASPAGRRRGQIGTGDHPHSPVDSHIDGFWRPGQGQVQGRSQRGRRFLLVLLRPRPVEALQVQVLAQFSAWATPDPSSGGRRCFQRRSDPGQVDGESDQALRAGHRRGNLDRGNSGSSGEVKLLDTARSLLALALVLTVLSACGGADEAEVSSDSSRRPDRALVVQRAEHRFAHALERTCKPYDRAIDQVYPKLHRTTQRLDVESAEGPQLTPDGIDVAASMVDRGIAPAAERWPVASARSRCRKSSAPWPRSFSAR